MRSADICSLRTLVESFEPRYNRWFASVNREVILAEVKFGYMLEPRKGPLHYLGERERHERKQNRRSAGNPDRR